MIARWAAILSVCGTAAAADRILSATFTDPTTRYPHGVLGDTEEWGTLEVEVGATVGEEGSLFSGKRSVTYQFKLPEDRVFEDVAPRLWDITGDGAPEVVVVLSTQDLGAALVVIGLDGNRPVQIASTPHIGQRNRWLAPVGAADMDGDGHIEVAYVDRPHLAKTLRVWRFADGDLQEVAAAPGLTNHRIGEADIGGGLRVCDGVTEMITASADWTRVVATRLVDGAMVSRDMGPHAGRADLTAAMNC